MKITEKIYEIKEKLKIMENSCCKPTQNRTDMRVLLKKLIFGSF